jgi:hypothetical protein
MKTKTGNLILLATYVAMLAPGCGKANQQTLVDAIQGADVGEVSAIEQLDVDARLGRPAKASVLSARVLKTVAAKSETSSCAGLMSHVDKERHLADHPISVGNIVFRVKLKEGFYIVYCELLELQGLQYCSLRVGAKNETNINNMENFQSRELVKWLSANEIKPR